MMSSVGGTVGSFCLENKTTCRRPWVDFELRKWIKKVLQAMPELKNTHTG